MLCRIECLLNEMLTYHEHSVYAVSTMYSKKMFQEKPTALHYINMKKTYIPLLG